MALKTKIVEWYLKHFERSNTFAANNCELSYSDLLTDLVGSHGMYRKAGDLI